jgi:DNA-binding winged helix-turn-helix (wHTH) protein
MPFAFGDFLLDVETRELRLRGEAVRVPPKVFALLEYLIRQRPKAVAKEELLTHVWPVPFVSEANLSGLVADLRTLLGDDPREPRFIRTVHGFGYSWIGSAQTVDPPARDIRVQGPGFGFRISYGRQEIDLVTGDNYLGREPGVTVWIDDPSVSRRHACIRVEGDTATLEDLASKNGTFLRGERIAAPCRLENGDEIKVGKIVITMRVLRSGASTRTSFGL